MPTKDELHYAAGWVRQKAQELLNPQPRCLALFGSFPKGTFTADSDIDILLVGDDIPRKPYERTLWVSPLVRAIRHQINLPWMPKAVAPLLLTEKGWLDSIGLRLSLSSHAWILLDDGFLSASLLDSADAIRRGDWVRRGLSDGGWLWIPKGEVA